MENKVVTCELSENNLAQPRVVFLLLCYVHHRQGRNWGFIFFLLPIHIRTEKNVEEKGIDHERKTVKWDGWWRTDGEVRLLVFYGRRWKEDCVYGRWLIEKEWKMVRVKGSNVISLITGYWYTEVILSLYEITKLSLCI